MMKFQKEITNIMILSGFARKVCLMLELIFLSRSRCNRFKNYCSLLEKDSFSDVIDIDDVPESVRNQLKHFIEHHKDLEEGKYVTVTGWQGKKDAETKISKAMERYNEVNPRNGDATVSIFIVKHASSQLGSTASGVVTHAHCPVMVVR
jgi:Inorganic pyrophosphatase